MPRIGGKGRRARFEIASGREFDAATDDHFDELRDASIPVGIEAAIETRDVMARSTGFGDVSGDLRSGIRDAKPVAQITRAGNVMTRLPIKVWYAPIVAAKTGFPDEAIARSAEFFRARYESMNEDIARGFSS